MNFAAPLALLLIGASAALAGRARARRDLAQRLAHQRALSALEYGDYPAIQEGLRGPTISSGRGTVKVGPAQRFARHIAHDGSSK